MARFSRSVTCSSVSGDSRTMTLRDISGAITEKLGFSVVAAMSVTQPFSTAGRRASCWLLLNRCTSSMKSTVPRPCMPRLSRARSITARTSFTPAVTADSSTNARPVPSDSSDARVVLPVPGGPQRITETTGASAAAVSRVRSGEPAPEREVLADDVVERARPHAHGQWRARARAGQPVVEQRHGCSVGSACASRPER